MELKNIKPNHKSGHLTTHVLDTARGCPAKGIEIALFKFENDEKVFITNSVTNGDGRLLKPILEGESFVEGTYELVFNAGAYIEEHFKLDNKSVFLKEIPIRFLISNREDHYHVPLLLSPFGFSSYRGS